MNSDSHPPILEPTTRTTIRRKSTRADPSWATVAEILDEGIVCHVGITDEGGPVVTPMVYARITRNLYVHGSTQNRTLLALASGTQACITVTIVDGLVLARSMFRHSMNYRSVMLYGAAEEVTDTDEQRRASSALVNHMVPGRSETVRLPSDAELRSTRILRLPIEEASAKVRVGGPSDFPADLEGDAWAGELPLRIVAGELFPSSDMNEAMSLPAHLSTLAGADRAGWSEREAKS